MNDVIKIAVDAMGGDGSPQKVIDGILHHYKTNKNTDNFMDFTKFDDLYPFRIFQIGFNKVGTVSLKWYFEINNIPSIHWRVDYTDMFNYYSHNWLLTNSIKNINITSLLQLETIEVAPDKTKTKYVSNLHQIVGYNYKKRKTRF